MVAQRQLAEFGRFPAPLGGINAVDGLFSLPLSDSIYTFNLIPTRYGLQVRSGYREWCTNIAGTGGVKTLIPVKGTTSSGTQDAIFAVSADGIYDVTTSSAAPTKVVDYPTKTALSGWSCWTNYSTIAGQFICVCDELNGYRFYDVDAATWTTVTLGGGANQIAGVDPALFAFVVNHKGRLWFIERDSGRSWYLPPGQLTGTATEFNWGNKFRVGGSLAALYSYTVDGGAGIDDFLVGISSAGDVIIYQGYDPATSATWDQKGSWSIGTPPVGRRLAETYGGDLILLSAFGAIPLSRLIAGANIGDPETYVTRKISPLINLDMTDSLNARGWEIKTNPKDNTLVIATPKLTGISWKQYSQYLGTQSWGILKDLPQQTGEVWKGLLYTGTDDGRVLVVTGDLDNISLAGTGGVDITSTILTAFNHFEKPAVNKQVQFARPYFLVSSLPGYELRIRYDYDLSEIPQTPTSGGIGGSTWDTGVWDTAIWGGEAVVDRRTVGGSGMGVHAAIAMKIVSRSPTILIGFDVSGTFGSFL